ncbi:MAG: hypothetical protein QN155_12005, partial [Armatimonadota bacterium]|nr:hypothetical protein [Armatimonadota bacterium]
TGNEVTCVDIDAEKIAALQQGEVPIYEPGLAEMIQRNVKAGRLSFTTDYAVAVPPADIVILAVGTPQGHDGDADLACFRDAVDRLAPHLNSRAVVVIKSTVPVGTNAETYARLMEITGREVEVASNPEFLKEGAAINDFMFPDRVVVGVRKPETAELLRRLYELYRRVDGELVEVNPLALTEEGDLVALDAKIKTDGNARFRHPEWEDPHAGSPEARAAARGLSYVPLEGDIGLLSNGAGLTMATMDELALAGGRPANFLDAGERILRDGIEDGWQLLEERPEVRVIFINIFGGGVRCDQIAERIKAAADRRPDFSRPVVVCLQGRNAAEGRQVLQGLPYPYLHLVPDMDAAVELAVALGGKA